jgi:hypothetical protein
MSESSVLAQQAIPPAPAAISDGGDKTASFVRESKDKFLQCLESRGLPLFSIFFPAFVFIYFAIRLLHIVCNEVQMRPFGATIEMTIVTIIPVGISLLYFSLQQNPDRLRLRRSFLAGLVIGATVLVYAYCMFTDVLATVAHHDLISFACLTAFMGSLHMADKLRKSWELPASRRKALLVTMLGALVPAAIALAAECRPTAIRMAEVYATANDTQIAQWGRALLTQLKCEPEVRKHCLGIATGGIADMIPFDIEKLQKLIYTMTGRAAEPPLTTALDTAFTRQYVGAPVEGLSLPRSTMYVVPSPEQLSGTVYWTFVFRNSNPNAQEARIQLHLPPGAVANAMTIWMEGKPRQASVYSTASATQAYQDVVMGRRDPALLTMPGDQTLLAQCYPVPAGGEEKLRISIATPMQRISKTKAALLLPLLETANCNLGKEHNIQVETKEDITCSNPLVTFEHQPQAQFQESDLPSSNLTQSGLSIELSRSAGAEQQIFAGTGNRLIRTKLKHIPPASPKLVVVVLDCGPSLKDESSAILKKLMEVEKSVPCSVIFADQSTPRTLTPEQAMKKLSAIPFIGGHDNTRALVRACTLAASTAGSRVIWVHGSQPGYDDNIYPLPPHLTPPAIYDISLDGSVDAGNRLLRNHRELGATILVPRQDELTKDIFALAVPSSRPTEQLTFVYDGTLTSKTNAAYNHEADCLAAFEQCQNLLANHKIPEAIALASSKTIVTPVTGAAVLERDSDYSSHGLTDWGARQAARTATFAAPVTNAGSAWDIRKNYMLRYPVANEFAPTSKYPVVIPNPVAFAQLNDGNARSFHMRYPFSAEAYRNDVLEGMFGRNALSNSQVLSGETKTLGGWSKLLASLLVLLVPLALSAPLLLWTAYGLKRGPRGLRGPKDVRD